jgi:hypothetical protein
MSGMPALPAREPVAARISVVDRVAAAMVVAVADMWRMPNLLRAAVVAVRILAVAAPTLAAVVDRISAEAAVRTAAVVAATEVGVAAATGAAAITSRL